MISGRSLPWRTLWRWGLDASTGRRRAGRSLSLSGSRLDNLGLWSLLAFGFEFLDLNWLLGGLGLLSGWGFFGFLLWRWLVSSCL